MALSASRDILIHSNGIQILYIILIASIMHLFYLFFNGLVVIYLLKLDLPESISVIIMASQKSSPVALAVISYIATDDDKAGLYAVPCIVGQLLQIFIGSFVATYFASKMTEYEIEKQKNGERGHQFKEIPTDQDEEKQDCVGDVEIVAIPSTVNDEEEEL